VIPAASRKAIDDADVVLSEELRSALAQRGLLRRFAILVARSADFWVCALVLLACWRLGAPLFARNAMPLLVATTTTGIAVKGIKRIVRRARPASDWGGSYRRSDPHSFPSGHAARVGVIATFAALVFPAWLALGLAAWAAAVATARVGLGVHYVSDVVVGLVLGALAGGLTVALL
jgi:undecaprenyl-diphosphatase